MPSLAPLYYRAADPGIGTGDAAPGVGLLVDDDYTPADTRRGVVALVQRQGTRGAPGAPTPPELRVPGDNRSLIGRWLPRFDRSAWDEDADAGIVVSRGSHVAQSAGAAEAFDHQAPEPPMYGNTWRMEPQPADTGWYVGVEYG